jgi:hypothetical protein
MDKKEYGRKPSWPNFKILEGPEERYEKLQ